MWITTWLLLALVPVYTSAEAKDRPAVDSTGVLPDSALTAHNANQQVTSRADGVELLRKTTTKAKEHKKSGDEKKVTPITSWVSESEAVVFVGPDGHITFVEGRPKKNVPANARSTEGYTSGQHYFEVVVKKVTEVPAVGVVTAKGFADGHRIRGLLYDGSLTDGGTVHRTNWGPRLTDGDVVGVLFDLRTQKVIFVTFYVNGRCLGISYLAVRHADDEYFPCISADVTGDLFQARTVLPLPTKRHRELVPKSESVEGQYHLVRIQTAKDDAPYPLEKKMKTRTVAVEIKYEGKKTYAFVYKITNTIMFEGISDTPAMGPPETVTQTSIKMSGGQSTRMAGPPGETEVETLVVKMMLATNKWSYRRSTSGNHVVMTGTEGTLELQEVEGDTISPVIITSSQIAQH